MSRALFFLVLAACGGTQVEAVPPTAATAEATSDSIYMLDPPLTDQTGAPVSFAVDRGHPTLVSMFYASCPMACPVLIEEIRTFEAKLPPEQRADLRVLLVSMDPVRDTPELMTDVAVRHEIDLTRWTLARTEPEHVREVAAVLGISYRMRDDGEMNHSSILTLVDREGRIVEQRDGLGQGDERLLAALSAIAPATP